MLSQDLNYRHHVFVPASASWVLNFLLVFQHGFQSSHNLTLGTLFLRKGIIVQILFQISDLFLKSLLDLKNRSVYQFFEKSRTSEIAFLLRERFLLKQHFYKDK